MKFSLRSQKLYSGEVGTWLWIVLGVITLISIFAAMNIPYDPAHDYWWNRIPAFNILYGFAGCVLIMLFSKALGKLFLQRKEDYYDVD